MSNLYLMIDFGEAVQLLDFRTKGAAGGAIAVTIDLKISSPYELARVLESLAAARLAAVGKPASGVPRK